MKDEVTKEEGKRIQEIIDHVGDYLYDNKCSMTDGIHALTVILLATCRDCGIGKPLLLMYISNMWEVNDPETDNHPIKEHAPIVRY